MGIRSGHAAWRDKYQPRGDNVPLSSLQIRLCTLRPRADDPSPHHQRQSTMVPFAVEQGFLTAFNFITFILVCIPLYWHLEGEPAIASKREGHLLTIEPAWNVGCILYIGWIATFTLMQGINCIVWRNNAINWAPVWGDICRYNVLRLLLQF